MNRGYRRELYLDLAQKLYRQIPDISISTDMMVGFPGETEADFEDSLDLVQQVGFSKVHIFSYSRREGTAAASMPGHIPKKIIKQRSQRLREAATAQALRHRRKFIGTIQQVLVERFYPQQRTAVGLTNNYLKCELHCPAGTGDKLERGLFQLKTESVDDKLLYGTIIS